MPLRPDNDQSRKVAISKSGYRNCLKELQPDEIFLNQSHSQSRIWLETYGPIGIYQPMAKNSMRDKLTVFKDVVVDMVPPFFATSMIRVRKNLDQFESSQSSLLQTAVLIRSLGRQFVEELSHSLKGYFICALSCDPCCSDGSFMTSMDILISHYSFERLCL